MKRALIVMTCAALLTGGCSETNRTEAPVELVATTDQEVLLLDLANPPAGNLGTIEIRAIPKGETTSFTDVRLINYRVTYRRTDGGTVTPEPFIRTTSGIVSAGAGAQSLNNFTILTDAALSQAPFAALLPQNGGRDPETGENVVKLEAGVEIFGQTLAGQNVKAVVRIPLWVCVGCTS